jgi:hypothetical protein
MTSLVVNYEILEKRAVQQIVAAAFFDASGGIVI